MKIISHYFSDLSEIQINQFSKLEELYNEKVNPASRGEFSAALKGKSNISNYLREIIKNTKKEVIICTNAKEIKSKEKLFSQTFKILNDNKVKIKFALSGNSELIKQLEKFFSMKIKKIDIDTKFFIVDRKETLFYLSKKEEENDIAIWLNSIFFSEAFASLFDKAVGGKK
jgi:sugar-specific transcriptional regulator TrmB